ncbi:MAG TPA: GNAT family N-acetyltransferase [Verrucomicrobiales bacterium]|nr:GNAT family N-acetyltransferase [Verrucomicrobiales bacterium]
MIHLRRATPDDIPLLQRWDDDPDVVASNPNDDWEWEDTFAQPSPAKESLIAEPDGRPIGFLEILNPALDEERYWGDTPPEVRAIDIWIGEPELRGRGHGTEMMRQALARCFARPEVGATLIDPLASNVAAHRFYLRLGFEFVEERRFGPDDCHVFELTRERWSALVGNSTAFHAMK